MDRKGIVEAIQKLKAESKKRNFKQSIDIIIVLKGLDMKKPENKIKTEISLPHKIQKPAKIGIFADMLIPKVKGIDEAVLIRKDEIDNYSRNKKAAKQLAKACKSFLAEAPLMPLIGKTLGPILAPRNKMPSPILLTVANIQPLIEKELSSIKIALKDSPTVQCSVGAEDSDEEQVTDNIMAVIAGMQEALPKGKEQIKNIYIKLTMSRPLKIKM